MTAVITINQLTRCFKETTAVDQLSLEVHAGEIFGFLGHNGAGKTTTVRLLNGVIEPTSGRMRVLGLHPQADGLARSVRTGVLAEAPSLHERLIAQDNVSIYADVYRPQCSRGAANGAGYLALGRITDLVGQRQFPPRPVARCLIQERIEEQEVGRHYDPRFETTRS